MAGIGHRGFMGRKKSGSFTPIDDPDLYGWYPFDITANITESGGAVSGVLDNSGNGWHLNSNKQPTTGATTQNGLNVLNFSNQNLRKGDVSSYSKLTFIQVIRRTSNSPAFQMVANSGSTSSFGRVEVMANSSVYRMRVNNTLSGGTGAPLNTWVIIVTAYNGVNSYMRVNGTTMMSGDVGGSSFIDYEFGTSGNNGAVNPGQYFTGDMAEIITTTSSDITTIEEYELYLNNKWAIY